MRDVALPPAALLLHLVEELGCRGVRAGSAHENTVNVVGSLIDPGRDAGGHRREAHGSRWSLYGHHMQPALYGCPAA
ncbi:MAG TPA: hypothetical protein VGV93_01805 [Acidimicrobiales bacterium]|nr:hypothetical protein [Acidimicrobiales bacterium]